MKIILFALLTGPLLAVTNSITLVNNTGSTVSNSPLQFARPFVEGEIADYPAIEVCTTSACTAASSSLTTQANVKVRWGGGSVKHAIISVLIPSVPTGNSYYRFVNQASCNCGTGLTKTEMLDSGYNFDAQIQVTPPAGTAHSASARTILNDWDGSSTSPVSYWAPGTVATTVILADLTSARTYHFGWEPTCTMTTTATIGTSDSTITVADNSCLTTPTKARIYFPISLSGNTNQNGTGEDIYICTKTSTTTLNLGASGCASVPSTAGRHIDNTSSLSSYGVGVNVAANNSWQDPSSSSYDSMTPIFIATFWPTINKVYVRVALEASDGDRIQDQVYDVTVTTGNTSPTTEMTKSGYVHRAMTAWTRAYWLGTDPDTIDIIHNMAYLASTSIMFNYSDQYVPSTTTMDSYWTSMNSRGTTLGDRGPYTYFSMGTAGGRPEIGPETAWWVAWVLTGYEKIRQVVYASADIAPSWGCMIREGSTSKKYDRAGVVDAFGLPIVPTNRKTLRLSVSYDSGSVGSDNITPVGPYSFGAFVGGTNGATPLVESEHLYNAALPLYVLTGDWYYYQIGLGTISQNWMTQSVSTTQGRGPTAAEGALLYLPIRGQSWPMRTRGMLATFAPDGSPEKTLFTQAIRDQVCAMNGVLRFSNPDSGDSDCTTMYNWGRNTFPGHSDLGGSGRYTLTSGGAINPLGLIKWGTAYAQANYGIDTSYTEEAASTFELGYFAIAYRYLKDAGYNPAGLSAILGQVGLYYIGSISGYTVPTAAPNPYIHLGDGRAPTVKVSDGSYVTTWSDMKLGYFATEAEAQSACGGCGDPKWRNITDFIELDAAGSFDVISMAAIPQVANQTGGAAAWAFDQTIRAQSAWVTMYTGNPQWALLPRDLEPANSVSIKGNTRIRGRVVTH